MAEHLIKNNYNVYGTSHVHSGFFLLPEVNVEVKIIKVNICDQSEIIEVVKKTHPCEIYNFAARSSSSQLFDDPIATADINGLAVVRILEAIRTVQPDIKFCQASSSEIFAGTDISPQDENTPYIPLNAYGAAKAYANNMVTAYRNQHGIFASNAILFNHESPLRSLDYVTRKITHTVAKIRLGLASELILGNLDSTRDWGFAGDYARAMCVILQQPTPDDYVIATGFSHSVREFCEIAFSHIGLDYQDYVRNDPKWQRRSEQIELRGNPAKLKSTGWSVSMEFSDIVRMMVDADVALLKSN